MVLPGRAPGEQAWHWHAAHDTTRALVSAWQAAGQAGRALAYAEQLAMLSRVLELWEQVPDAAQRTGADHVAVLEEAVRAAERAGEDDQAITLAQAALREIDAAAEPVRAALLLMTGGHLKHHLGRVDYADDLREAVRLVPADPPSPARARVLQVLAHCTQHVHAGWDDPELRAAAEEAVVIARQAGDADTEAAALITLADAEPIGGNVERVRALLEQARAIASRAKAYQSLLDAATTESEILEGAGLHEQAAAVAREGLTAARDHGLTRTYGTALAGTLAEALVSLGRWDEATEVIEGALRFFAQRVYRTYLWRLAGDIALARGDLAAAAESVASIRPVLDDTRYLDQYHLPMVRLETELLLAQVRPAGALSAVEDALDRFDVLQTPRYTWPLLVAGARTCAATTALDNALLARAAALRDHLRAVAGKLAAEGLAQEAYQLTFAAEAARAGQALAAAKPGGPAQPGDLRAARDQAAQAWEAAGEPVPAGGGPAALRRGRAGRRRPRRRRHPAAPGRRTGAAARRPAAERRHRPAGPAGPDPAQTARRRRGHPSRPGPDPRTGTAGTDRAGTGGAAARRGRAQQPRNRRRAVHLRQDRQRARVQHPRQAERGHSRRSRGHRPPAPPL